MIEVQEITKQYGEKVVLDKVGLQFHKGKVTSLIGSNGAGKSTLLSVISRLLSQDGGVVMVDEKNVTEYKNRMLAQRLSILKQSNHVRLKLTVRELVSFGRFPYSQDKLTKEDMMKVDRAIDFLNLRAIEHAYIDELSGGQKQRAYMAMVVAQDTEYILLDEPLNNLDMKHSVQTMKMMRQLADELGKTIIVVLHDINFASHYSDYIVALKDGKVIYHDTTDNIIREDVLKDVFGVRVKICEFDHKRICNYF
ncbi:MAG: iron ABC transporter ATP-binding protein [Bacteroidetes bacterium GWD2_45_23]|jgi:iron complex transport system ATP-binding protein|nr:MAG: iron ABC transporter ATP-binding protein [Bacteroidetes bacterium GWC2_46_850]OFX67931.1 MAG: iron ABC transporter ATP-binding protein [Bacteroidetes bacterium GWC1_47_7]OFX87637.1 MAG: iron ABC transporter ATP-binding protein [Bacteroidetes bacterium GWD2_45_23]HAR37882.1 iron ABC transporter ATP-binding protein [Porphyromonadaceae bacterium]HBB01402.1 iron ABC transporter ATP-binding protein [Porphyromonadaceae bacterium]